MRYRDIFLMAAVLVLLSACTSPGDQSPGVAGTTTVPTFGAQNNQGGQRQAIGTETGSATNTVNPSLVNIFGAKSVKITRNSEGETIEAEGADDASVEVSGANLGVTFGNEGQRASVESGQAATGSDGASGGPRGGGGQ